MGIHAKALKTPDFPTLMIGRANTSCKECIPLILTTAGLLDYVDTEKKPDEKLAFFMPILMSIKGVAAPLFYVHCPATSDGTDYEFATDFLHACNIALGYRTPNT